ncbi:MAG: sigma-70 family RNA polymerase sigma factor [Chloroflexota bacterium]
MDGDWLAKQFEENRGHLQAVAWRMLGSAAEADDAVQEAWLRFSGANTSQVENLGAWLTTVVARVCLDMLRSRNSRREDPFDEHFPDAVASGAAGVDPEHEAILADSVGPALLVVLEVLSPAERVAFVLHDVFAVPFDEIGTIVGRTPDAARQLASRARRRVQGATTADQPDTARQQRIVNAFLAAARSGDFEALLNLLDPNVVLRADSAAVAMGARSEHGRRLAGGSIRGAQAVVEQVAGGARILRPAIIGGVPGLAWTQAGRPRVAFHFTFAGEKIVRIDLVADPETLSQMNVTIPGR